MRVRWRLTKARHAAISYEVVEWSEQLRLVTSVWLGANVVSSSPAARQFFFIYIYTVLLLAFCAALLLLSTPAYRRWLGTCLDFSAHKCRVIFGLSYWLPLVSAQQHCTHEARKAEQSDCLQPVGKARYLGG